MLTPLCASNAICVFILLLIALIAPASAFEISFIEVPRSTDFPSASAPKSLRHACAGTRAELADFFKSEGLRFDPALVRTIQSHPCHIHYEPTAPGFRAHPESAPAQGLFLDLEHVALLSQRTLVFGDNLDMARTVLANLPRALDITFSVPLQVKREYYQRALESAFPGIEEQTWLRDRPLQTHHTWAQDYLKSGELNGQTRVLLPRLAFEGQSAYGQAYKSLLKSFSESHWIRSKLSWDGGDLILIHDPRDRSKRLLLYGDAARPYWGEPLTPAEYGYVLAVEFGADEALDFGGLAPHIDYFVSILPDDDIALVAEPLREDFEISRAAVEMLASAFPNPVPDVVAQLRAIYSTRESAFVENIAAVRRLIGQAQRESASWTTPVDGDIYRRLEEHIAKNCKGNPAACVEGAKLTKLLDEDPGLLQDWWQLTALLRTSAKLPTALLSVLESQLPGAAMPSQVRIEQKIRELQQLGFRVIRVPRIGGETSSQALWAGISYVNAALIDEVLFVPVFGLGAQEHKFLTLLQGQLPAKYRVVPVFARYAQLYNGGAHCILAFLREPGVRIITESTPIAPPQGREDPANAPAPGPKTSGERR